MAKTDLTAQRLRELLSYDLSTGVFTRLVNCSWLKAGATAGSVGKNGYRYISVDGRKYLAHRLAWLYVHGELPNNHVDHINGDPADNRIANLRDVTMSVNIQNQRKPRAGCSTGALGVSRDKRCGSFRAHIVAGGRQIALGYFKTVDEAHSAYLEAKRVLHPGCTI